MQGRWLLGALLTEVAAVCHTLAAVFMRRATQRGSAQLPPVAFGGAPIDALICRRAFWGGLCLRAVACWIWWYARYFAPDTTVAPLFVLVSFLANMATGPSLLHEQYRSREVAVTLGCIIAVAMASDCDAHIMDPWPSLTTCIVDLRHEDFRVGRSLPLLCCALLWLGVVVLCLVLLAKTRRGQRRHAAPVPVLAGLMSGATYFVGYVGFPFCSGLANGRMNGRVSSKDQIIWGLGVVTLGVFSVLLAIEGARRFDCRYFVPASTTVGFFSATVMRVLLSEHHHHVDVMVLVPFLVAHVALLVWPFFISSTTALIKLPQTLKKDPSPQLGPWMPEFSNPLRYGTVDPLPLVATPLLEFGHEPSGDGMPDPEQEVPMLCLKPPKHPGLRWLFFKWVSLARVLPAVALLCVPLLFLAMALSCQHWLHRLVVFAAYTAWAVGATGLRIAVFASVGRLRIKLCIATDYPELCKVGRKTGTAKKRWKAAGGGRVLVISDPFDTPGSSSSEDDDTLWQTVRHIVVVDSDEGPASGLRYEELRDLLHSIEASPLAATQVGVLLATRSEGAAHKRAMAALQHEFAGSIRWLLPVPSGSRLAGLVARPGCAHSQLFDFAKRNGFRSRMVLVTYTTPDAVFHRGYFSCLTFAFLSCGEMRSTTIWQPPVLHIKDYGAQPGVIKHVSLFLSQHQLASLTDPIAVPLPSSTCSIPLSLLRAIDSCWVPDFPLLLANSGIWTKCWLTTIGRSSVKPIFLPVLRSSVHGDDPRLGAQLQHFTQGLVELVYFWSALPLALFNGRTKPSSVGCNRLLCLFLRSLPPLLGITWAHIVMSTWFLAMCFNAIVLLYGWRYWPESSIDSGPFLLILTTFLLGLSILPMLVLAHVALMEQLPLQCLVPPGAEGEGPGATALVGRPIMHALRLLLHGLLAGPMLFCTAFLAEWRRAIALGCQGGSAAKTGGRPAQRKGNRADSAWPGS